MDMIDKSVLVDAKIKILDNSISDETLYQSLRDRLIYMMDNAAFKIPVMPKVITKLLSALNDDRITFEKLSEIIKSDPVFTVLLIKTANTSFYSTTFPITNIESAVRRIGLEEVKRLLLIISFSSFIVRDGKYGSFFKNMWEHSILTAIASEELAKARNIASSGEYIAGLLHDIGKVFVFIAIMEIEKSVGSIDFPLEMVDKLIEEFHIQFGGYVADRWQFPDYISDAILYHKESSNVLDCSIPVLHVYFANLIAKKINAPIEESLGLCVSDRVYAFCGMKLEPIQKVVTALPGLFEKQKVAAGL